MAQSTLILIVLVCLVPLGGSLFVNGQYNATENAAIVIGDDSNDAYLGYSAQQLITLAGFSFKEYYVTGDDGYISLLIRLINPLVTKLRRIPIMLHHGALIDSAFYVAQSTKQHHPEKYPRNATDGPITSSNRSLAFFLSNQGFDVWLIGTRGSNTDNQGHYRNASGGFAIYNGNNTGKNMTAGETAYEYERAKNQEYWQYGLDDIPVHDFRVQIDLVRSVSNSTQYTMFTYSLSTPTSLAFMGLFPDYAKDCLAYIQLAPAIIADHENDLFDKTYFETICNLEPTRGDGVTATFTVGPLLNQTFLALTEPYAVRYTVLKAVLDQLFGSSPTFMSNLERNVVGRIEQPVSFKSIQQYCQQSVSKQFQKFNYGPLMNMQLYNQLEPPTYNTTILVQNYIVISGTNDALASPNTVQNVLNLVKTNKSAVHIVAQLYNHLDLGAGVHNDRDVYFPLLEELNKVYV